MAAAMTKQQYREAHRQMRIRRKMADEVVLDVLIYGSGFQRIDSTGVYNIPPSDIYGEREADDYASTVKRLGLILEDPADQ